jgi:hypothetical protein
VRASGVYRSIKKPENSGYEKLTENIAGLPIHPFDFCENAERRPEVFFFLTDYKVYFPTGHSNRKENVPGVVRA